MTDKNGQAIEIGETEKQACGCSVVDTGMGYTSYPVSSAMVSSASIKDGFFIGVSGTDGDPMTLEYRKTCVDLVADGDVDTIPDGLYFIPQLALAYIYIHRGEENRGQNLHDTIATNDVASFYKAERNKIKPRQWGENIKYS